MTLLDRVKSLCKEKGISQGKMEKAIGISNGASSKWKNSSPSLEILKKLSDFFGVSVDYLMNGEDGSSILIETNALNEQDKRQINRILAYAEKMLKQDGLMFEDGTPANSEAVDSIISAMHVGMEMAKKKNKELYTPKKYKKD